MCAPLSALAIGATLVGGAVSGISGYQQQRAAAAQSEANAASLERQSLLERDKVSYETRREKERAEKRTAKQIAAASASGFLIDGSTLDFIEETSTEADLDIQAIRYGGQIRADNLDFQARQEMLNAKSRKRSAPLAFVSPIINSGTRLASGFS